jgi:hypothetical protein
VSSGSCSYCSHDKCAIGAALEPTCNACVNEICAVDPFCCDSVSGSWDSICQRRVRTDCGSLACSESQGSCSHSVCVTGAALVPQCDDPPVSPSCAAAICAVDPFCCDALGGTWDDLCIGQVDTVCGSNCY